MVHLSGHATSDGMDAKLGFDVVILKSTSDIGDLVLGAAGGHTVTGNEQDTLGLGQGHRDLGRVCFGVLLGFLLAVSGNLGNGVHAAENDVENVAIHGVAHDLGKDGSGETDKRADDGQEQILHHESFHDESPAGVGIEHGDAHGHVAATNGTDKMETHDASEAENAPKKAHAEVLVGGVQEETHHGTKAGEAEKVEEVLTGQSEGLAAQPATELTESHEGTGESNTTDKITKHDEDVALGGTGVVLGLFEFSDGGQNGGKTDEGMEGSHGLGEGHGVDGETDDEAEDGAASKVREDDNDLVVRKVADGADDSDNNTVNAEGETLIGSPLAGESGNRNDAQKSSHDFDGSLHVLVYQRQDDETDAREEPQVGVVAGSGSLEEQKHALRDDETTDDVNSGNDD